MKAFERHCWVIRWISSHGKSGLGEMPCHNNLKIKHAALFNFRCDARDRKEALGEKSVLKRLTRWSLKSGVNLKAEVVVGLDQENDRLQRLERVPPQSKINR